MGALFDAVREGVSAREASEMYGLAVNRHGKSLCPWHEDHRPSLSFKGQYCKCFACGGGGSAIDLAAQLFALSPLEAARRLSRDFHLPDACSGPVPRPAGPSKAERRRALLEWRNHRYSEVCEVEREARQWLEATRLGWDSPAFRDMLTALALAQDELEILHVADVDELAAIKGGEATHECSYVSA